METYDDLPSDVEPNHLPVSAEDPSAGKYLLWVNDHLIYAYDSEPLALMTLADMVRAHIVQDTFNHAKIVLDDVIMYEVMNMV